MNTLRAKIALLLVTSIVAVVALITITMIYAFSTPEEDAINLAAKQAILVERLASHNETRELAPRPAKGELDEARTAMLRAATAQLGVPLNAIVAYEEDRRFQTVSVAIGSRGWLVMEIDAPADVKLLGWLVLITIGVGAIAVLAAYRMSRPLALLESAAESVGPDGTLPVLPERGPAEVRVTAAALNSLSARVKRAIESRMRLIADAGHDFRTPLTRMRLRAEFVSDAEERTLWLHDIKELEHIADSAIQLVRDETTKAPPEVLYVDDLVKSVTTELRDQNLEIEVSGAETARVKADRLALSRALRNLLINAATHGRRGTVSVAGGSTARITISDQGPGIAPELLEHVFEPFFRGDRARTQHAPGAGLGLTISREIIRRAGGEIRISNSPGGGLIQIVELPTVAA
jgi:signal transduction histidine kinase